MTDTETLHLTVRIARPAAFVYRYTAEPTHLPAWAHGLGDTVEQVDGAWVAHSGLLGRVTVTFTPENDLGVLDHYVTFPTGETVHNPIRVIPYGDDRCELVFTLRRPPGTTDAEFAKDAETVAADLARLRDLLENEGPRDRPRE
ncbi:SRPBCC family protein [Streptomyces roseirectus]|uniref:SRPBCC family protein n=1 Tax=Streptomyces roseirectus TaxID=2768066 RepID=A0A7H0IEU5_9ACTN|nr:SRPBCC family protein [Streptomyces roseirectus]QNP71311.1 SRPBCC family protein [Streptomyces roseirectus]